MGASRDGGGGELDLVFNDANRAEYPTPFALGWPDQNVFLKSSLDTPIMRLSAAGSRAGEGR
jgi:hypothetical protein